MISAGCGALECTGISFGGVMRSSLLIRSFTFYAAMASAALIGELIFGTLNLVPAQRNARVVEALVTWNSTTWLSIIFLIPAGFSLGDS